MLSNRLTLALLAGVLALVTQAVSAQVYSEDFEGATPLSTWTLSGPSGAWHVTTNAPANGSNCLGYVQNETASSATADGDYDFGGAANSGYAVSEAITVPATGLTEVSFELFISCENSNMYDLLEFGVSLSNTTPNFDTTYFGPSGLNQAYTTMTYDISAYNGQTIYLMFEFDTIDAFVNNNPGVRIDDISVTNGTFPPTATQSTGSAFTGDEVNGFRYVGSVGTALANADLDADDNDSATIDITIVSGTPAPGVTAPANQTGVAVPFTLSWTGTPTAGGNYTYTVTLSDGTNNTVFDVDISISDPALPDLIYYKLNDGTGTTAQNDAAGTPIGDGTFTVAPTWNTTTPQLGTASATYGGTENIATGLDPSTYLTTEWTVEFWVNTTSSGLSLLTDGCSSFDLAINGGGNVTFSNAGSIAVTSSTAVNDGNWHHVAFTFDSNNTTSRIYIDGSMEAEDTTGTLTVSGTTLQVGAPCTAANYTGGLDEFRLWGSDIGGGLISAQRNTELPAPDQVQAWLDGGAGGAFIAPQTDLVVATGSWGALGSTSQSISSITVTKLGTIADTAITDVKLWLDDGTTSGVLDGSDTQIGGSQTFSSGTATFTGSPLDTFPTPPDGSDLLVTFTIAGTAVGGDTFGASINASTDLTASPGPVVGTFPSDGPTHVVLGQVSTLPFSDDFESGNPGNRTTQDTGDFPTWTGAAIGTANYTTTGRIRFTNLTPPTPTSGTEHAIIDSPVNGTDTAGAIDYLFDLSSFDANNDEIHVRFQWADGGDETDVEDGVFYSTDNGATWNLLNKFDPGTNADNTYNQVDVNWSAILLGDSLNFTNQMILRFQQQDNFSFGSDALIFDDIWVGTPAEIDVSRNSTSIPHRGTVNVGNVNIAGGQRTFSVDNLGQLPLNLTGTAPDYVVVTAGANLDSVSVSTQPNTPVAGGGSETFVIDIDPTTDGIPFDFTVQIDNDDGSPVQLANGTDGVLTLATSNFSSATASFVAADVGTQIVISGSGSGNDGTYTITAVNSATDVTLGTAPAADEGTLNWSHESSEGSYTFTVTGDAVLNGSAEADPATGSSFTGPTNGPLTYAVDPGTTLANADVELTDPESDNITVTAITPPGTVPTGITAPTIPAAGHPITLSWTGVADASNAPGDYTWTVTFNDAVNGSTVNCNVTITINDVAPTHAIQNADSGDGSAGTPYATTFVEGDNGSVSVDLATVSDGNTGQTLTLGTVNEGGGNPTTGVFQFVLAGGSLTVAPAGTLIAADIGTHTFDMDVSDGTNNVTINVSIQVLGSSGAITFTNTSPLANGTVGTAYSVTLTATGGTAPYTYSVVNSTSLPAGLSLNGTTGEISGTPTTAGLVTFDVRAIDSTNDTATATFQITINAPSSGGGGGGGDDDGGCSTGGDAPYSWMIVLGLLSLFALATRLRNSRA